MLDRSSTPLDKATLEAFAGDFAAMARAAWRVELAQELAGIGMDIARALRRQVVERANAGQQSEADVALSFSRIARAVRLSLALEARLDEDMQGRSRRARAETEQRARLDAIVQKARREAKIKTAVEAAIEVEAAERAERGDAPEREWLLDELDAMLEDDDECRRMARGPVAQAVAHVCRELGVRFDPDDWVDDEVAVAGEAPPDVKAAPPGVAVIEAALAAPRIAEHPPP